MQETSGVLCKECVLLPREYKRKYFFIILKYLFASHPFNLSVHHMRKVNDTSIMLIVCLDFI